MPHIFFSRVDHRDRRYPGCECQRCMPTPLVDRDTRFALPIVCPKTREHVSAETLYNRACADLGYVVRDHIGDLILDNLAYPPHTTSYDEDALCNAVYAWADGVRAQIAAAEADALFTSYLASSTPGEANARYYAIINHIAEHGRTSNALDERLEAAEREVNQRFEVAVLSDTLIFDDVGITTKIRVMACPTMIGLRRDIRLMNPGHIDTGCAHDCSGRVCFMGAKLLHFRRSGNGYVAVVEWTIGRDV